MRIWDFSVVVAASLLMAGGAMAQETTQPSPDAAPAAVEAPAGCVPAQPPGRLMITVPKEPARPGCAEKASCSKAVADQYNTGILAYNKSMTRINEATADYVDELNDYARAAGRYAQCEIDRLNEIVLKR